MDETPPPIGLGTKLLYQRRPDGPWKSAVAVGRPHQREGVWFVRIRLESSNVPMTVPCKDLRILDPATIRPKLESDDEDIPDQGG